MVKQPLNVTYFACHPLFLSPTWSEFWSDSFFRNLAWFMLLKCTLALWLTFYTNDPYFSNWTYNMQVDRSFYFTSGLLCLCENTSRRPLGIVQGAVRFRRRVTEEVDPVTKSRIIGIPLTQRSRNAPQSLIRFRESCQLQLRACIPFWGGGNIDLWSRWWIVHSAEHLTPLSFSKSLEIGKIWAVLLRRHFIRYKIT